MSILACWTGILGALLLAIHINWSPYAYVLFLISSWAWIEYGREEDDFYLVVMNAVFFVINMVGIARWVLF